MKWCSCFGAFAIACSSSTTGFQCWQHPSRFVLTGDSGSLRSWFGHERVGWGWGCSTRANGLHSQVSMHMLRYPKHIVLGLVMCIAGHRVVMQTFDLLLRNSFVKLFTRV